MRLESTYRRYLAITGDKIAAAILAAADTQPEHALTPKQAAARLGVSTDLIYAACASGKLPSRKIGRAVRIEPRDLDHYCEDAA
ncbi:MAG TPA: helix-turn-helix domain-containing protein [Lacipirellulaceae bacterium]|nr:helix-turn-helix domain-containing protein [Lacipirellulaceae bacterium]HMP06142.1 helix-turn-helix domain-containing protein [Lacipirellulaceae bacterium]